MKQKLSFSVCVFRVQVGDPEDRGWNQCSLFGVLGGPCQPAVAAAGLTVTQRQRRLPSQHSAGPPPVRLCGSVYVRAAVTQEDLVGVQSRVTTFNRITRILSTCLISVRSGGGWFSVHCLSRLTQSIALMSSRPCDSKKFDVVWKRQLNCVMFDVCTVQRS